MDVHDRKTNKGHMMPDTSPRARTQGPRDQRKRPGDLTGVRGQQLAAQRDNDRADQLAAATQVAAQERVEKLNTVVDYTQGGVAVDEVAVPSEPELHPEFMTIRVNYPIEEMTFGREVISPGQFDDNGVMTVAPVLGRLNRYDFEEGVQYKVPWDLGMHLKSLGYVYDY